MNKIKELANELKQEIIQLRRDFHRYPEAAWTEFRTAAIVAEKLQELGYEVLCGAEVIDEASMMGVPAAKELAEHARRAVEQGAKLQWVEKMQGGKTGVVGIMRFEQPGPVLALRFDMDANDAGESEEDTHRPFREGFSSVNKGVMHACGHDGHTAIGLIIAKILTELKDELKGTVKLIFQPAEEGVRGAKAMVATGIVDDADYFFGMHIGFNTKVLGQVACSTEGFLATTKLDAIFSGVTAHAGAYPETGKNALLAASAANLNLHAISRHSKGVSRINVGYMQAGTGRNVVPANAVIKLETRGNITEINDYMVQEATRIINAAAKMYDVNVEILEMGGAPSCQPDLAMGEKVKAVAEQTGLFQEILPVSNLGASEDCTYFMERVQSRGGRAVYMMVGSGLTAGHHNYCFDFDEEALYNSVVLISGLAQEILK